jgi:hypothetical protein
MQMAEARKKSHQRIDGRIVRNLGDGQVPVEREAQVELQPYVVGQGGRDARSRATWLPTRASARCRTMLHGFRLLGTEGIAGRRWSRAPEQMPTLRGALFPLSSIGYPDAIRVSCSGS